MTLPDLIDASDVPGALQEFDAETCAGRDAWDIHRALFSVVQRVQNPPFINPHLPKMHAICRDLFRRLRTDAARIALARLEVEEYARRPKLPLAPPHSRDGGVVFEDIQAAIAGGDVAETAAIMTAFAEEHGQATFARMMLLLGSGYLESSLGHSISCTAFILLEMMNRQDQNQWPVMAALAHYFIQGSFFTIPPLNRFPVAENMMHRHLLRATSGRGIVNLHHTITIYAIDAVRHLFGRDELSHLVNSWIAFIGDKDIDPFPAPPPPLRLSEEDFRQAFMAHDVRTVMAAAAANLAENPEKLHTSLVSGVCSLYNGNYNPHNLTGLGSVLWIIDRYGMVPGLPENALFQYVDYYFTEIGT